MDEINKKFMNDAGQLLDLNGYEEVDSFSSYNSNKVTYSIDREKFNIETFMSDQEKLKKFGWVFYHKYGESYIFCDGESQLEIMPPQKVKSEKLKEGDRVKQLEKQWNITFYYPKNTIYYDCHDFNKNK